MEAINELLSHKIKGVWNPKAIKYIAIFCSLIPGSILFSMNYVRLNHPYKIRRVLTVLGVTILYFILAFIIPSNILINGIFFMSNVAIAIYFASDQKKIYDTHTQNGGKRASILIPAIFSILFIISIIALLAILLLTNFN